MILKGYNFEISAKRTVRARDHCGKTYRIDSVEGEVKAISQKKGEECAQEVALRSIANSKS